MRTNEIDELIARIALLETQLRDRTIQRDALIVRNRLLSDQLAKLKDHGLLWFIEAVGSGKLDNVRIEINAQTNCLTD